MKHIILDTDPGVDDALAILLAFNSPELKVEAITTVAGNVNHSKAHRNAKQILEFIGKINVIGMKNKAKKQVLVVSTCSSAWASKLRFYLPALKRSLCSEAQFSHIQAIQVKAATKPSDEVQKRQKNNKLVYSSSSAKIIQQSAQHIADNGLKSSLLRLSQHISKAPISDNEK